MVSRPHRQHCQRAEDDEEVEVGKAKRREPLQGFFSVSFLSPTYWEERGCFKVSGDYLGSAIYNSWKCYFSQEIILNGLQIASF